MATTIEGLESIKGGEEYEAMRAIVIAAGYDIITASWDEIIADRVSSATIRTQRGTLNQILIVRDIPLEKSGQSGRKEWMIYRLELFASGGR